MGKQILKGHGVKLEGPFGSAYFRPALNKRLILISSGTGFAPVWSIANAAIKENPRRHIVLIVSAREHISLYMGPAIRRLKYLPNIAVIPVVDATQGASGALRTGRPTDHIPALRHSDVVYACGGPKMVDAAKAVALAAGADFYADPFIPQSDGSDDNVFTKAIERLSNLMSLTDGTKRSSRPLEIEDLRPQLEIPPENLPQGGAKLQLLAQLTISTNHVDISPESLRARRAERRRRA